jgi:hypothetical protein
MKYFCAQEFCEPLTEWDSNLMLAFSMVAHPAEPNQSVVRQWLRQL